MKGEPMKVSVSDMTDEALACRATCHDFDDGHDYEIKTRRGRLVAFRRLCTCERCRYTKVQIIDGDTFEVIKTADPRYPARYLHNGPRLRKADARREQFRRRGFKV